MDASHIYIVISILVLAVIAISLFFLNKNKENKKLTPFAGLAFAFVIAGILFSDDPGIGYLLIGIGIIFAVIDIIKK
ncbi:MAG: hypothetical protein WC501_02425 [Candidatus Micrarchaeia archaeon]